MKLIRKIIHLLFFDILRFFTKIVIRIYLRNWQVTHYDKNPHKGPVIFAPNHQNGFLDSLIILFSQTRRNYFLSRASAFKTSTARFWLEALQILPIYRVRDGFRAVSENNQIMKKCIKILTKKNGSLVIFSEGGLRLRRTLNPLQKGIARIAFATMEANNFDINLAIVPTGLNYGRHTRFRSDMLLNFGKPIYLKKYTALYKENPNQAYQKLINDLFKELEKQVLSIKPSKYYAYIENEWLNKRTENSNLALQFKHDKQLIAKIAEKYKKGNIEIPEDEKQEPTPKLPSILYRVFMFPFFLYGYLNSYISYKILDIIIKKIVLGTHFYGSIKSSVNLVLAPLIFLIQSFIIYMLTNNGVIAILYFITSPLATILAFDYKFSVFDRLPRMKGLASYKAS